jgi:hypothetical protein
MELLLNILWAMLALPAVWLWWRRSNCHRGLRYCEWLRAVVLMVCAMALLFPVISVTDDLHVARPEMEESKPSRRVKQLVAQNASGPLNNAGGFPAQPVCSLGLFPRDATCGQVLQVLFRLPKQTQVCEHTSRPPPATICQV